MKKILSIILLLFNVLLTGIVAADRFEVIALSGPATAAPGEKITVNMTVKVLEVDSPVYLRPAAQYNFPADKKARNLPADQMIPWKIEKFKVGDTLKLAATFTLPEKLTPDTEGQLRFMIYRTFNKTYSRLEQKLPVYKFKVRSNRPADLSVPRTFTPPVAVVPNHSSDGVRIDGSLSEAVWQQALSLRLTDNSQKGTKVADPAELKIFTDYKHLYVALISPTPIAGNTVEQFNYRDGSLWKNDGLECIFSPGTANSDFFQFMSDSANQQYDGFNADTAGFNPVWSTAYGQNGKGWVIEAAIPLSAIAGNRVVPGSVWRADFFRTGKKYNTAWSATLGSHSALKRYGWLVFGSMEKALSEQGKAFTGSSAKQTAEMQKLLQSAAELQSPVNATSAEKFVNAWEQLQLLQKKMRQLQFAERFANRKSPLIVQWAEPYAAGVPAPENTPWASNLEADFYAGEVRDFALNLTNSSKQTLTVRCGLFATDTGDFRYNSKTVDYLHLNIPDFAADIYTVTPVAAFDGTPTGDALAPNPAGTLTIAPGATQQLFISIKAPDTARQRRGQLVISSIAEHAFEPIVLPIEFTCGGQKLPAAVRPIAYGWDYMHEIIVKNRRDYTRQHYAMLKEYGFNTTLISNLRHLPRPRASADGQIPAQMDFSRLEQQLELIGKFDYYYLDIAIWNQKLQNKELFYLDFYDPAYAKAFKSWFAQVLTELKKHDINESNLLVCPIDEAADKRAEIIASWIKEVNPAVKVIIDCSTDNMQQLQSLDRYVDVWMPHMRTLPQEALAEFHKYIDRPDRMRLAYYYSAGGEEKIKSPYADYILNFYRLFSRGFAGLGFWAAGQYYGDPWYRKAYPGVYDTSLIYPGSAGPIPSRRLAAWRRGFQDLWLLRAAEACLGKDSPDAAKLRQAAAETANFPADLQRADSLRKYCRQVLENMK